MIFSLALGWPNAVFAQETEQAQSDDAPADDDQETQVDATVTVEGQRPHPHRLGQAPGTATSTIERDRLTQPGVSAADALREAPGVQISQSGGLGAPATARVRGATAAQTPVYLGRVRLNDEVGGVTDLSTIPQFFLEKIEIHRSHAPGFLSQQGIGGAIVLVPRRPEKEESTLQGELGSFGTRALRASTVVRDEQEDATLFIAGDLQAARNDYSFVGSDGTLLDDTKSTTSRLPNADASTGALWALGTKRIGKASFTFLGHYARREQGAPKVALVPSRSARAELNRSILSLDSEFPLAGWRHTMRVSTRFISGKTTLRDPGLELGAGSPFIETPGERLEQEWEGRHYLTSTLLLRHMWTLALERLRRYERQAQIDIESLAAKRFAARAALGAQWRPVPSLTFEAIGSGNCFGTSQTQVDICTDWAPTGQISGRFERRGWEAYVNAGRYVRLPTLSELHGLGILVRGNPTLDAEQGTTVGSGFLAQLSGPSSKPYGWIDVSGFVRYSASLITYVRTAQGYLRPVNRKASRTFGAEISAGARPLQPLLFEASLSLLDPRDTSPDRITKNDLLPFLSRATAHARVEYEWDIGRTQDLSTLTAGARAYFQSSRYADPAGLGVIPGQFFIDLEMGARLYREIFHLRGRVSNLFDVERFDVVGFPLPGRSAFLSLEARL